MTFKSNEKTIITTYKKLIKNMSKDLIIKVLSLLFLKKVFVKLKNMLKDLIIKVLSLLFLKKVFVKLKKHQEIHFNASEHENRQAYSIFLSYEIALARK